MELDGARVPGSDHPSFSVPAIAKKKEDLEVYLQVLIAGAS